MRGKVFILGVLSAVFFLYSLSYSGIPQMINYQGKITTPQGALIDTTVEMIFTIYDAATDGGVLWADTQSAVVVEKGVFSVILGAVFPIDDSVFNGDVRYLGIKVGADPEMTPRSIIGSVAYAYRAAVAGGGGGVPVGTIVAYGSPVPPDGWLICSGAEVSRTEYASLFSSIGTLWGDGDGLTTFNIPDLRGRGPIGAGQGSGLTNRILAEAGGEEQHALTIAEMPSHTHSATSYEGGVGGPDKNVFDGTDSPLPWGTVTIGSSGGDQPHNNMQPYAVVNFIIKY